MDVGAVKAPTILETVTTIGLSLSYQRWPCAGFNGVYMQRHDVKKGMFGPILLKKSSLTIERNCSAPLVCPTRGGVRDHIGSRQRDQ